jgi:hypothetical protein
MLPYAFWQDRLMLGSLVSLRFNDFGKFYYSARAFLTGAGMYGSSPSTMNDALGRNFWNLNPPHFHLLLLPLAYMPIGRAFTLWAAASLVALGCSLRIIHRELGPRSFTPGEMTVALLAMLAWAPTAATLATGQLTWLLLLPMTAAWAAARRQSWGSAGAWCGICASVKPFLLVFLLYFCVARRTRAALVMAAVLVGIFAVAIGVFGWTPHRDWLATLSGVNWSWAAMNGSLLGFATRSLAGSPYFSPLLARRTWIEPLWLLAAVCVGTATWRAIRLSPSLDRHFALVLLAAQLMSPLGWAYYLWLPVGPALAAWQSEEASPAALFGVLILLAPLSVVLAWQPSGLATITIGSAYFWGTVCVWSSMLRRPPSACCKTS